MSGRGKPREAADYPSAESVERGYLLERSRAFEAFVRFVLTYSNDPGVVAEARRLARFYGIEEP